MTEKIISITEVTVVSGKTSKINFDVNGQRVSINVPVELKAYFETQFSRQNPTPIQKRKYATIMNLMRFAYTQGYDDGSKSKV